MSAIIMMCSQIQGANKAGLGVPTQISISRYGDTLRKYAQVETKVGVGTGMGRIFKSK